MINKQALQAAGYKVEDMGVEYGPRAFAGQFRWVNVRLGAFQTEPYSRSEDEAWADALAHDIGSRVLAPFTTHVRPVQP